MSSPSARTGLRCWQPASLPGFDDAQRLLLPLRQADFAHLPPVLDVDGVRFRAKREYHVTLVGSALAARIAAVPDLRAELERYIACTTLADWQVCPQAGAHCLAKSATPVLRSVVRRVALPIAARLYDIIERGGGAPLARPPLHVTLYWVGDPRGIGLATEAEFDARWLGPVDLPAAAP